MVCTWYQRSPMHSSYDRSTQNMVDGIGHSVSTLVICSNASGLFLGTMVYRIVLGHWQVGCTCYRSMVSVPVQVIARISTEQPSSLDRKATGKIGRCPQMPELITCGHYFLCKYDSQDVCCKNANGICKLL